MPLGFINRLLVEHREMWATLFVCSQTPLPPSEWVSSKVYVWERSPVYVVTFCWSVPWGSHFQRWVGVGCNDLPEPVEGALLVRHDATVRPLTTLLNRFSSISPCTRTGLLFLTSLSYTDPDQFVYKTRPPRERPDAFPDVMMNSYLGLWPLRWQMNYCLAHGHFKIVLVHTEHKSSYFLFHFQWNT